MSLPSSKHTTSQPLPTATTVELLLQERDTQYAQAWIKTGKMIGSVITDWLDFCQTAPEYIYAWIIILNKLVRLLANPYHYDSWKDIAGYATLVVKNLEGSQKDLPG